MKLQAMLKQTKSRCFKKQSCYTVSQVADILMLSASTVRRSDKDGELPSILTPGAHRRYTHEVVIDYINNNNLPMPSFQPSEKDDKITLVIIDDDTDFCQTFSRLLSNIQHVMKHSLLLHIAHNGFQAGQLIERVNPNYIILNLNMPGINGFDLCSQLTTNPKGDDYYIWAMTEYNSSEIEMRILSCGAKRCFEKPTSHGELQQLIQSIARIIDDLPVNHSQQEIALNNTINHIKITFQDLGTYNFIGGKY